MAKRTDRLSDRTVRTAKAGLHCDGAGLYLQVTAGREGISRSWLFRFATGEIATSATGKLRKVERSMGLGRYPDVSLADAREKAAEARKLRAEGKDPIDERDGERAAARTAAALAAAAAMTFDQCRDSYVGDRERGWGSEHRGDWLNSMTRYVTPVFGTLPVAAVDTPLVLKVLRPLWDAKYPTARVVRERIQAVLDWAIAGGYRPGPNPATWRGHLDKLLREPDHVVDHHAALPYQEVADLVADLETHDDRDSFALLLLIYTATRCGAAVGARGEEFDLGMRVWTVPASRMKRRGKRKAIGFRVPLSDPAIAVVKRIGVTAGPLFPSADHKSLGCAHGRAGITVHGFRSTFRDWAADCTPFPREIAEMAMSHVCAGDTEEAYFRSDLLERRRPLMDAWAKFCRTPWTEFQELQDENKVLQFPRSAA